MSKLLKPTLKSVALSALGALMMVSLVVPALAGPSSAPGTVAGDSLSKTEGYYLSGHPNTAAMSDRSFPGGQINYGDQGQTDGPKPRLQNPGTIWPEITPPFPTTADEKTAATFNSIAKMTGVNNPQFGAMPSTALGTAMIETAAAQLQADYEADPQNAIARAKEEQNQANQTSADTNAQMERNQAGAAIDFVASYLYNFTVEANNKWNRVRNELFLPMALLLLLPGVALAQLKATVSAGTPVIADVTSPFDGLLRAIVGIFLIPGTYLFINYGIDVSNSITYTIQSEYKRIFHTDMYKDAMCAHIRAFPYRNVSENKGYVPSEPANMNAPIGGGTTTFAKFEGQNLEVALRDPCANLNQVPKDRSNEQVPHVVNAQRNAYNTANSALAMTWNILCAFQMAYLYYLWFVGPIIAALWVYPMKELRDAFPAWINGVCTICFWSLFWNTTILLMACCRGVDETGTLIMSALNFLSTACVKFAFDFAGLAKEAGMQAAKMAEQKGGAHGGHGKQGHAGRDGAHSQGRGAAAAVLPPNNTVTTRNGTTVTSGGTNGDVSRTVSSSTPGLDFGTDNSPGAPGSRSLDARSALALGNVDLSGEVTAPPIMAGSLGLRGLHGGDAGLLNAKGSPFINDAGAFVGGGPGGVGADGADADGDGIPDNLQNFSNLNIDSSNLTAGAFNGMTLNAGMNSGANFDVNHNAHHNALHLSQNDLQNLFMNNAQSASVREQLQAQMSMQGGPGGVFVDGSNGASQFINAQQMAAAFSAVDQAAAAGGDINVSNLLSGAGVDLPSASFSGLNMSPAAALNGGVNGSFVPPGSDNSLAKSAIDPQALSGGMPLTNGGGGVVPPDVMAANQHAALDRMSSEINGSMATIQAQNMAQQQAQVQAQVDSQQQQQQQQFSQQQLAQQQLAQASFQSTGDGGSMRALGGDNGFGNGGPGQSVNPQDQMMKDALRPMVETFGNPVPDITAGGAVSPVNASGLVDTSYAAGSAVVANTNGVSPLAPSGDATFARDSNANLPTNAGNLTGGETVGSYLSKAVGEQWTGKDGFEARMVDASVKDQSMARESTNAALTYGNSLQGSVQGTVSGSTAGGGDLLSSGNNSGYIAATPQNYAQASADNAKAGMDPLARESMDSLAQTFQGFVPEVNLGGNRNVVETGGLGAGSGSGGGSSTGYAQSSFEGGSVNSLPSVSSNEQRLTGGGEQRLVSDTTGGGNGGFFASSPSGDAPTFDKGSYLSNAVGEQWRQYDQNIDQAVADQYKAQIYGAVESTYSRASGSIQDNVVGAPSSLPAGQMSVTANDGSSVGVPSGGLSYDVPAPAGGHSFARESADGNLPFSAAYAFIPGADEAKRQMEQLAKAIDYTPEINLARNSISDLASGDAGVPAQQLPSNMPNSNTGGGSGVKASVPVPMQLRYGNVAINRADALKSATNVRSKEALDGTAKPGGKTNALSSALGKAASKPEPVNTQVGAKSLKDPLGTVAAGNTLRRLRQKRQWSQAEMDAFQKLAGQQPDADWDM